MTQSRSLVRKLLLLLLWASNLFWNNNDSLVHIEALWRLFIQSLAAAPDPL